MGRILKRIGSLIVAVLLLAGCGNGQKNDEWMAYADLGREFNEEDLYAKALKEDILIVYTVSTRVAETKDSFEKKYPGLYVEVRDLRSPNLIEAVEENYKKGLSECDVVICNDNSGDFKARLVDTGIVVPYVPSDIKEHLKAGMSSETVSFVNEAEMLFYNSARFSECPIGNIWELTDSKYKGRIYLPNPLRSFSTYAFCGSTFDKETELKAVYEKSFGEPFPTEEKSAAELFWRKVSENAVFTNSSDEVMEALGNGNADFGILVSSKLRFKSLGYNMEPVYRLTPFCGCRTSFSVMVGRNSKNINSAKLFVEWLMGGADGQGEGLKPFSTEGTWSARTDVPDANPVSLDDTDLLIPNQDRLIADKEKLQAFFTELIQKNTAEQP